MAQTYNLISNIPNAADLKTGDIINCPYSGTYKTITLPKGTYKLECWGAQGGSYNTTYAGGKGGYSYGTLTLTEDTDLHLYTGGAGTTIASDGSVNGGFNGGGLACTGNSTYTLGSGGGASDIRIGSTSLHSRAIVAGGGGGCVYSSTYQGSGGAGGGSSGVDGTKSLTGSYNAGTGGTQTSGGLTYYKTTSIDTSGAFGAGGYGETYTNGGGGGWYGGGGSRRSGAGGGSGYVYTSSTISSYPSGCTLNSSYYLTEASTKAGNTSFTDYSGATVTGHEGNGAIRITALSIGKNLLLVKTNSNTWNEVINIFMKITNDKWANLEIGG